MTTSNEHIDVTYTHAFYKTIDVARCRKLKGIDDLLV